MTDSKQKSNLLTILKIIIMVGAYGYLTYSLITFKYYDVLISSFKLNVGDKWFLFVAALLLMPINWGLESAKWFTIVRQIQPYKYFVAYKSVLMGLVSGFFTPNRICDPIGRVLTLEPENRGGGILLTFVGSLAQSFATCLFLLIAVTFVPDMPFLSGDEDFETLRLCSVVFALIISLLYITLPLYAPKIWITKYPKVNRILQAVSAIKYKALSIISVESVVRYAVYCIQYFLMLRFMGVEISVASAFILIPINYFLVSVTPSYSFSEIGVRGSYAMVLFGGMGQITDDPISALNAMAASMAAVTIWVINYIIPMLVGSWFLAIERRDVKEETGQMQPHPTENEK
ncbi:MAG: flippase-like domain-containing protein [Paludibacteraceae bacterium]|nr:flippase-like domain-containing protein [Paludibacteraceae bacterium]